MIIPIAVVPVAGLGTRLLPATKSQPKEMLPVAKKPVVQYVVEELEANDIRQILFITGKSKTSIENHFDFDHELMRNLREGGKEELLAELEYERMPIQFFFTRQRRQKGLGDAVLCGRLYTQDSPFVVALGDSIIGLNGSSQILSRMARTFESTGAACVIAVESVPLDSVSSYGIVKPGDSLSESDKRLPARAPGDIPATTCLSSRMLRKNRHPSLHPATWPSRRVTSFLLRSIPRSRKLRRVKTGRFNSPMRFRFFCRREGELSAFDWRRKNGATISAILKATSKHSSSSPLPTRSLGRRFVRTCPDCWQGDSPD